MALRSLALVVVGILVLGACGGDDSEPGTIVYAVGDAADGSALAAELASYVKEQDPDRFFYLGDVYATGTADEFDRHYEPLYGALAARTDPVIGNHEDANFRTGYHPYWKEKRGWRAEKALHRSYIDEDSGWQVIAYSSEKEASDEAQWLAGELEKHEGTCRIAIAHRARHSIADDEHADNKDQQPVWRLLAGRAAINLAAHSHVYGRLEPIDGTHVIISGQGGHDLRGLGTQHHPVEATASGVPTATRLELREGEAELTQVDADGKVYDSGTITCTRADEKP